MSLLLLFISGSSRPAIISGPRRTQARLRPRSRRIVSASSAAVQTPVVFTGVRRTRQPARVAPVVFVIQSTQVVSATIAAASQGQSWPKATRSTSKIVALPTIVVSVPPIVLSSEKWARQTRSASRIVIARVSVAVPATASHPVQGAIRVRIEPVAPVWLSSQPSPITTIGAATVSGALWPKITRAASRRVISVAGSAQPATLVRTIRGAVRTVKQLQVPSQWITLTGIVIPVPPIVATGERWARPTRSRSRVIVAAVGVTVPSNASRALKGITRVTIKPVAPAWYISQPSAIGTTVTAASAAGAVWPKPLRARSRIVVPLREHKPLVTLGEKWSRPTRALSTLVAAYPSLTTQSSANAVVALWPIPTRAESRLVVVTIPPPPGTPPIIVIGRQKTKPLARKPRVITLVFNSGGLTPSIIKKAFQKGKQLRAKSVVIPGVQNLPGTPPIVVSGKQKTKPFSRKPRVISLVYNSGGLTPTVRREIRPVPKPTRGASHQVIAPVFNSGGQRPTVTIGKQKTKPRQKAPQRFTPVFNSSGITPRRAISGVKRNPYPLRSSARIPTSVGIIAAVGIATKVFIAPTRSLNFVAPVRPLIGLAPVRSILFTIDP